MSAKPYCIGCGEQNITQEMAFRCLECWRIFSDGGGVQRIDKVITYASGINLAQTTFANHALFCRECGGKLDLSSSRMRYALRCGSECHYCDSCHIAKRFPRVPITQ